MWLILKEMLSEENHVWLMLTCKDTLKFCGLLSITCLKKAIWDHIVDFPKKATEAFSSDVIEFILKAAGNI